MNDVEIKKYISKIVSRKFKKFEETVKQIAETRANCYVMNQGRENFLNAVGKEFREKIFSKTFLKNFIKTVEYQVAENFSEKVEKQRMQDYVDKYIKGNKRFNEMLKKMVDNTLDYYLSTLGERWQSRKSNMLVNQLKNRIVFELCRPDNKDKNTKIFEKAARIAVKRYIYEGGITHDNEFHRILDKRIRERLDLTQFRIDTTISQRAARIVLGELNNELRKILFSKEMINEILHVIELKIKKGRR